MSCLLEALIDAAVVVPGLLDERRRRIRSQHRRSQGTKHPVAARPAVASQVINTLKQGQLLFAYYPDQGWLAKSRFLHCHNTVAAAAPAVRTAAGTP